MSNIPEELHYTKNHEWVKMEEDGTCRIGITDYAQSMLGDIVFIDLPEIDTKVDVDKEFCTVESVKAASDIYAPISGTIAAVNKQLENSPDLINSDPYGEGWLCSIKPSNQDDINKLLSAADYKKIVEK